MSALAAVLVEGNPCRPTYREWAWPRRIADDLSEEYVATLRNGGWRTAITELHRYDIGAAQLADTNAATGCRWAACGAARIERQSDGSWTPREDGVTALVLPAMDDGEVTDLIAWTPDDPRRLYGRQRDAWCVGVDSYWWARWCLDTGSREPPLRINDDVLAWLRAGGDGVLIVDWQRAALHLAALPRVLAGSIEIANRLDRAWRQRAPEILLPREKAAA